MGAVLTVELLEEIRKAEQHAEELRQNAVHQAREMVNAVEEANAAQERQATIELRALSQSVLDETRVKVDGEIERLQAQKEEQLQALSVKAHALREQAAQRIFERIVNDGHC